MNSQRIKRILIALYRYFIFFILVSFVVTCCMLLFLYSMAEHIDITFTSDNISSAAKQTFINVAIISLLFTVIDALRRRLLVERPAKRIAAAAAKMADGDFGVRIKKFRSLGNMDSYNEIIDSFNKMAEELSGIETLRTDFISNVSHELKTPLTAIGNYATVLSSPSLSESERKEYAKAISEATRKLSELVTNILRLNKLENQQIYPNVSRYDLGEQLCECLLGFESAWEAKSIEIETDIEDGIFVSTDREMMTLVGNNLFSNAIKFTDEGGKVSLSLKSDGNFASVTVSDTGCGISSETGEKIFDKFYQGDTSHATSGNGLGLTLVKRVIDVTGGQISVQSRLGEGTSFTVRIRRDING